MRTVTAWVELTNSKTEQVFSLKSCLKLLIRQMMAVLLRGLRPELKTRSLFSVGTRIPLIKEYHITVSPAECMQDEEISVKAAGLSGNEDVTISARMVDDRGKDIMSYAHYQGDGNGFLDLSKAPSLGGSYTGTHPMGLLNTLSHTDPEYKYRRYNKKDVTVPNKLMFCLSKGHLSLEDLSNTNSSSSVSSALHVRRWMGEDVQKIPVKHGRLRGSLFIPPGDGPFPSVIDIYGTNGGLMEARPAMLASKGIFTFALAYFKYDDLPKVPDPLDLSYFEEATEFILNQPKVFPGSCAAVGISKGADIAFQMGTYFPQVKTVVGINGVAGSSIWPTKWRGKIIPAISTDMSKVKIENNVLYPMGLMNKSIDEPETLIPFEESDAKFLFIVGLDDANWDSPGENLTCVERFKAHGKTNYEVLNLEGTGHLIDPPYMPFKNALFHPTFKLNFFYGGNMEQHCDGQVKAWNKTIEFIKENVC